MSRSTKRKGPTRAEWAAALLIIAIPALLFLDVAQNAPYNARALTCQSNLRQIGAAIHSYRSQHHGRLPPDLRALIPGRVSASELVCPLTGFDRTLPFASHSYAYRFPAHPADRDIILWDRTPHHPWHPILLFLNRDRRNVLYADGTVATLPEDRFRRLNLQGESITLAPGH